MWRGPDESTATSCVSGGAIRRVASIHSGLTATLNGLPNGLLAGGEQHESPWRSVSDKDRQKTVVQKKNHTEAHGNAECFCERESWADRGHLKQDGCEEAQHQP
jgi:hypothetical protein